MKDQVVRPDEATPVNLTSGDIIQYGDEWKYADETQWKRVRWHLGETVANFRSKEERSVELRRPTSLSAKSNLGEVDPGEGYRLLEPGELVQVGDEFFVHGSWCRSGNCGQDQSNAYAYRRPISEKAAEDIFPPKPAPEVTYLQPGMQITIPTEASDLSRILDAAINGDNPDQRRIAKVGLEWLDLILRKNADYGCSVWEVPVLAPTTDAKTAILVRMSDKVSRIGNLLGAEQQVKDETLEDTLRDLGAYCLLYLAAPKPGE